MEIKCFLKMVVSFVMMITQMTAIAQLPKTDLYVAEFKNLTSRPHITSLKFLNSFNPTGYNNQPSFFSYDDIYITAGIDTNQITDIFQLNLKKEEITTVTNTYGISEFSPEKSPVPNFFSVVRIESDGKTQSLWMYPIDRSSKGKRLFSTINNIGYYSWLTKDSVALFLVGQPNSLAIGNIVTNDIEVITDNVGRCLKKDVNGNVYFVHKVRADLWLLKYYSTLNKNMITICQMPLMREDFDILTNGDFIIGDGSKIKIFRPGKDKDWTEIADLDSVNIRNITRIAATRDRILFINNR